ncbi:ROK family protein [Catenulispora sp. GP43]|uniref:ROK family protein n=1 Tax=Catenulispora sp. GP43 TaxID=3156263 RepID=UPI003517E641
MDVGGTHVTAAMVEPRSRSVVAGQSFREPLNADGSAEEILSALVRCGSRLAAGPGTHWAVAVPGPFDYERGIARYAAVGKFDALYGVDVRAALLSHLPGAAGASFYNDAQAFLAGEWWAGAARGHDRAVGITLGTGVGSSFLRDGRTVHEDEGPGVPPEGRVDLLRYEGLPLEETVSRRAIRRAYSGAASAPGAAGAAHAAGAAPGIDVRQIAERARAGDPIAVDVLSHAFRALGTVLGPCLAAFEPTVLVVGGSIAASWDLVAGPLRDGLAGTGSSTAPACKLERAHHLADAPLLGAAHLAAESRTAS